MVPAAERAPETKPDTGLAGLLVAAARAHPDRLALVEGDVRLSFTELHRRARAFADTLLGLGVRPGDVVTVQLPTWWETEVVMYAVLLAGAVHNPVVSIYRAHELGFVLHQARPRVLVVAGTVRGHDHLAAAQGLLAGLDDPPALVVVRPAGDAGEEVAGATVFPGPGGDDPDLPAHRGDDEVEV